MKRLHWHYGWIGALIIATTGSGVMAQTSSLYVKPTYAPVPMTRVVESRRQPMLHHLAPALARNSLTSVSMPEPRYFAVHDLITIIVRESSSADSTSKLDTEKKSEFNDKLNGFPNLRLDKLLQFQLTPSNLENPVSLDLKADHKFQGDGQYSREDTVTGRVTAQIIDVKPNGLLVLEARKFVKTDQEQLELVLTGTCRADDVTIDNTVLSTQLYDLHLNKQHKGALKQVAHKGILTKILDLLFNF